MLRPIPTSHRMLTIFLCPFRRLLGPMRTGPFLCPCPCRLYLCICLGLAPHIFHRPSRCTSALRGRSPCRLSIEVLVCSVRPRKVMHTRELDARSRASYNIGMAFLFLFLYRMAQGLEAGPLGRTADILVPMGLGRSPKDLAMSVWPLLQAGPGE